MTTHRKKPVEITAYDERVSETPTPTLSEAREELRRELPDAYDDGSGEPVIVVTARAARVLLDETYTCPACGQNCLGFDPDQPEQES
jgi:hypothetical protein